MSGFESLQGMRLSPFYKGFGVTKPEKGARFGSYDPFGQSRFLSAVQLYVNGCIFNRLAVGAKTVQISVRCFSNDDRSRKKGIEKRLLQFGDGPKG